MKTIVTHNGEFHVDDVFAVASLTLLLEQSGEIPKVIRTRDESVIATGDYVVDVGGIYDPKINRFDHHQTGGAGQRDNGIPYAAFGLVWKTYGEQICGSADIARRIDHKLIMSVDAMDNGVSVSKPVFDNVRPYSFSDFIFSFRPTWKEKTVSTDVIFEDAVHIATQLLRREIEIHSQAEEAEQIVREIYEKTKDKRLITLDDDYPWHPVLTAFPEPLYVLYPSGGRWKLKAVRKAVDTFENRKDLPQAWAGKRDTELQKITGVPDAVFVHNKLFNAVAESKEGILALAKLALES